MTADGHVTGSDPSDAGFTVTAEIAQAVMRHMNDDHAADNALICAHFGGFDDVVRATLSGVDDHGAVFDVTRSTGSDAVRVPWSAPLTDRASIRREFVAMHAAAGGQPPDAADTHSR
jgi:hypothetical protein